MHSDHWTVGRFGTPSSTGIWIEMVTTLRARYESIKGESEAMRLKKIAFHA